MFPAGPVRRGRSAARKNRRADRQRSPLGARRFALESLEPRQMLSASPAGSIGPLALLAHADFDDDHGHGTHGLVHAQARYETLWIHGEAVTLVADPALSGSFDDGPFAPLTGGALHPLTSIPILNSNPGALATIYLDFNGHFEPNWGGRAVTTPVYDIDGDLTTFSDAELQYMYLAWQKVAEDYAPFNINVTTVEPPQLAAGMPENAANGIAVRVAIGDGAWYGGGVSGIALINSFTNSASNTVYVFAPQISSDRLRAQTFIGDVASHEAGHAFGLSHQSSYDQNGVKLEEYNSGNGAWAPLMGYPYTGTVVTWHNGPNSNGPTSYQDDMAVIASVVNGFGYRLDDHGSTLASATPLSNNGASWGRSGVIETNGDADVFSFTATDSDTYRVDVHPAQAYSNLDVILELRSAVGALIAFAAPTTSQGASIAAFLATGTYFVSVSKVSAYGWVGTYTVSVTQPSAGIAVSAGSPILVPERGAASVGVSLNTQPAASVTVPLTLTDPTQATLSVGSLIFTPANWNVPQVVTLNGTDDGLVDGDVPFNIAFDPIASGDPEYAGLSPDALPALSTDHAYGGFAYWIDRTSDLVQRASLNGGSVETLFDLKSVYGGVLQQYSPRALAVDAAGGKVYWTDQKAGRIQRANLDGSGAETLLSGFADGSLLGIEVDANAGKVYWVDSANQKIQRANLDGSAVQDLVTAQNGLWDLALDVAGGKMYWGTMGDMSLRRANLDGSGVEVLWTGGDLSRPRAIALDVAAGKMYWADSGTQQILRANLNGANPEVIADESTVAQSPLWWIAVDPREGKVYWTDLYRDALYRMNLDGSDAAKVVSGLNDPQGVAIVAPAVAVTPYTGLVTSESGASASFKVSLTTPPTANVTIPISSSNPLEGAPAQSSVTFTPANWSVPQTVTVVGLDDNVVDGVKSYTVLLGPVTSADPDYAGVDPRDVALTNIDNDLKFYVVDDGSTDRSYQYLVDGSASGSTALASGNSAPRGVASSSGSNKTWVLNSNRTVYVYDAAGALLGSWTAGAMNPSATPEGIATDGTDVWIVDAKNDVVYRYAGAASRLSGSQNAASSFNLNSGNKDPTDLVTDGASLWVLNNSSSDKVFKYTLAGGLLGSWTIDAANTNPTGIALDPANPGSLLIVDSGADRVYQYANAAARTSGSQAASGWFALTGGNANPQGIAAVAVASTPVVATADLAVTSSAVAASTTGSLVTFDLVVTNHGPDAAANVVLTNTLGPGWLFSAASASQGTFQQAGSVVTFTIGALAKGQTVTAQVRAQSLQAGALTNTAAVTSGIADANGDNNTSIRTVVLSAIPEPEVPIVVSGPITVKGKSQNNITTATFTHAGGVHPVSYYVATINWGDGTTSPGSITKSGPTFTVKGSHTYPNGKDYTVTTTVKPVAAAAAEAVALAVSGSSTTTLANAALNPDMAGGALPSYASASTSTAGAPQSVEAPLASAYDAALAALPAARSFAPARRTALAVGQRNDAASVEPTAKLSDAAIDAALAGASRRVRTA